MDENKNIFVKLNNENEKVKYYKVMEQRHRGLCMENRRQAEYIKYLEYILDQNHVRYYRVNLM